VDWIQNIKRSFADPGAFSPEFYQGEFKTKMAMLLFFWSLAEIAMLAKVSFSSQRFFYFIFEEEGNR